MIKWYFGRLLRRGVIINDLSTLRFRSYHKHFNPRNIMIQELISLSSFHSNLMRFEYNAELNAVKRIDMSKVRMKGVCMQLESYDSLADCSSISRYQSEPTVLVLADGETRFDQVDCLIGGLVEKGLRVLAFRFPGWN